MKKIFLILIIFIIQFSSLVSKEPKLEEILSGLKGPWSLSFIDNSRILVTEKKGNFFLADLKNKNLSKINHNLNYKVDGQGGLLEILKHKDNIYLCYTEDRGSGKTSCVEAADRAWADIITRALGRAFAPSLQKPGDARMSYIEFFFRYFHVLAGIVWIGMLYYFNFVQTEYFKEAEAEAKKDAMAKLAPRALW